LNSPDISVVIPLLNEEGSIPELYKWIKEVATKSNLSCEIIFVDDGSRDRSWQIIKELSTKDAAITGIRFRRNYGKSAALSTGFTEAHGNVIITMDADLQDSPDEIPELNRMITKEGFDLVSGWKKKRHDPLSKTIPTKLFNWVTRKVSGIPLHDFNCGLKAYHNKVVKSIDVYGEMHRYIPVIAKLAGFNNIGEKVVEHQKRKYGKTKFGMERFINGFLDLMSITFVTRFGKRPMHLFGALGTLMFFIGFIISIWLGAEKLWYVQHGERLRLITDQPLFYIALATMIIGTQLFLTGFIAEMVARNSPDRNSYLIEEKI